MKLIEISKLCFIAGELSYRLYDSFRIMFKMTNSLYPKQRMLYYKARALIQGDRMHDLLECKINRIGKNGE